MKHYFTFTTTIVPSTWKYSEINHLDNVSISNSFVGGAGNSMLQGGDEGQILSAGLKGGLTGALFGGITNGLASGISAVRHGRDFMSGKIRLSAGLNHDLWKLSGSKGTPMSQERFNEIVAMHQPEIDALREAGYPVTIDNSAEGWSRMIKQNSSGHTSRIIDGTDVTTPGASIVNINPKILNSEILTYEVLGHELIHAKQYASYFYVQAYATAHQMNLTGDNFNNFVNAYAELPAYQYGLDFYKSYSLMQTLNGNYSHLSNLFINYSIIDVTKYTNILWK